MDFSPNQAFSAPGTVSPLFCHLPVGQATVRPSSSAAPHPIPSVSFPNFFLSILRFTSILPSSLGHNPSFQLSPIHKFLWPRPTHAVFVPIFQSFLRAPTWPPSNHVHFHSAVDNRWPKKEKGAKCSASLPFPFPFPFAPFSSRPCQIGLPVGAPNRLKATSRPCQFHSHSAFLFFLFPFRLFPFFLLTCFGWHIWP
jgi:hypothetical protein